MGHCVFLKVRNSAENICKPIIKQEREDVKYEVVNNLYFTSFLYASPIQNIQRSDTAKAARGLASNMKTRGAYCMKKTKAVRIASLISGISILFSMASVYAAEEIHQTTETEESGTQYENTIEGETAHGNTKTVEFETENSNENQISEPEESQSQLENSTTESEESQSPHEDASETESEQESLQEGESGAQSEPETEESTEEMTEIADESGQIEKRWKAGMGLTSLLMPQKFEIVMDPWEMDGRTQVYSKQYIIKNTGDMSGTLKLTGIACEVGEDVHVQENSDGIHSGKDKKLYIELLINDEDRFVLMPEGTDYEMKLAPDESITLEFTGEMNENTQKNWQDSDVKISVTYDWCVEPQEKETETVESISEPEEEDSESEDVTAGEGSEGESEIKPEEENPEDISEPAQENSEAESESAEVSTTSELESEEETSEVESETTGDNIETESEPQNESLVSVTESEEETSEAETTEGENNLSEGLSTEEGSLKIETATEEGYSNVQTETIGNLES